MKKLLYCPSETTKLIHLRLDNMHDFKLHHLLFISSCTVLKSLCPYAFSRSPKLIVCLRPLIPILARLNPILNWKRYYRRSSVSVLRPPKLILECRLVVKAADRDITPRQEVTNTWPCPRTRKMIDEARRREPQIASNEWPGDRLSLSPCRVLRQEQVPQIVVNQGPKKIYNTSAMKIILRIQ